MEYRTLGKTGLNISRLGFGGIPIQRIDAASAAKLMQQLLDAGINYIDTARGYTVSEEYIGLGLEGIRDKFILATKAMSRDKAGMEKEIAASLKNLRTDHIDLYQIHNPTPADLEKVCAPGGALEARMADNAAGKMGHLGVPAHRPAVFEMALELPWVETVMFPYNIVETQGENLIRRAAEKNIGFIVMKPLAGGAIEDATLALRFILQNENVDVVIPGMADPKELAQNVAACENVTPLTAEEQEKIDAIRQQLGTQFCRRCNYCAPCTAGISIYSIFLMEGYLSRYGLEDWARARYAALPKTASDCVGCGICEERCPYDLPIRDMMKRAVEKFGK